MEMNVSSLPNSQPLKLPIPRLTNLHMSNTSNTKFPEILIPNNWPPTTNTQFPTTLPSTISCQPMGKPTPNKRGRKPLSRMPETKKHIQNLTNQRAFRRRREDYVRTLENKASTYELLYAEAQRDIKTLRDKVELLEKRLAKIQENGNNKCNGDMTCNRPCGTSCDTPCGTSSQQLQNNCDTTSEVIMSNGPYDGNRTLPVTTPTTTSFPFNEQGYQQQITSKTDSTTTSPSESIDDIINDPVFCDTKDGEICFCEPLEGLNVEDYEKDQAQFSTIGRYDFEQRKGKRMWIINNSVVECTTPTSTVPYSTNITCDGSRKCCPTLPLPEQPENYFPPSSTSNLAPHHPLNLKWILSCDENNDNSI